jgi:phage tail-like protein
VNTRDILLHGLKGRYIWIYVAVHNSCGCELSGLRLEFPKYSFTEYFPEIYHGNDVFDRYIAVFQSMFLDLERMVDNVPQLLDYRTAPDELTEYLAGWLGIDNSRRLFSPAQLGRLIENIDIYQGAKGTKYALEQVVELLTGIRPRIIEHFEWMRPGLPEAGITVNKRLYGDTTNHFCVILDLTKTTLNVSPSDFEQLIEGYCVLGSQFKVIYLKNSSQADSHCYLDINGVLSTPQTVGLGAGAFGGHYTAG